MQHREQPSQVVGLSIRLTKVAAGEVDHPTAWDFSRWEAEEGRRILHHGIRFDSSCRSRSIFSSVRPIASTCLVKARKS